MLPRYSFHRTPSLPSATSRRLWLPRTVGLALGGVIVGAAMWEGGSHALLWTLLVFNAVVWPHLAYWHSRRAGNARLAERHNLMVDAGLGGLWIAAMAFSLIPSTALLAMLSMNNLAFGGWRFLAMGLAAILASATLSAALLTPGWHPESSLLTLAACVPFLLFYPLLVGRSAFRLAARLNASRRELARAEQSQRQLLDAIEAAIIRYDADDRIVFWNVAFEQLYAPIAAKLKVGMRFSDFLGVALSAGLIPEAKGNEDKWESMRLAQHRAPGEAVHRRMADGTWRRIVEQRLPDGGVLAFSTDVTALERGRLELQSTLEELHTSQSLLERSGRVAGIAGWQLDVRTGAVAWSPQMRELLEVDAEFQPTMRSCGAFYGPELRTLVRKAIEDACTQGVPWDLELPLVTAKGRAIWVRTSGVAEREEGQIVRLVGVFQDISSSRAMRLELEEANARVQDLYDRAPSGHFSSDADGVIVMANSTILGWLGLSQESVVGRRRITDFLTETGVSVFRLMYPAFKHEGQFGPVELELVAENGSSRWVSASATAVYDSSGIFVRSRSVMHDITDMRRTRMELQRISREQRLMLDNDLVAICKLREQRIVWRNRAFDRMFGYGPRELDEAATDMLYVTIAEYERVAQEAAPMLAAGTPYRSQARMKRKDGQELWADVSGMTLSADSGESLWMVADITASKLHQQHVEHIAFHDPLTGLANRVLLADRMAHAMALSDRLGTAMAVCCIDLDGFKPINDTLGHSAGDEVLRVVAGRLATLVRSSDTVSRFGGDEFVIVLTSVDSDARYLAVCDRLLQAIAEPVQLKSGRIVTVSGSMGIALYPDHASQPSMLVARADEAMYEAKRAGKSRMCVYHGREKSPQHGGTTGSPLLTAFSEAERRPA